MSDYHVNLFYSEEDGGYIADISDLKSCSAFGRTPEEALREVQNAKAAWLETRRGLLSPRRSGKARCCMKTTADLVNGWLRKAEETENRGFRHPTPVHRSASPSSGKSREFPLRPWRTLRKTNLV